MKVPKSYGYAGQRGFSLVAAIFILVVLALLGTFMLTMSVIERSTSSYAVQGARAYQAAWSGVEWGVRRAVSGACAASSTFSIGNFTVVVQCAAGVQHVEPQSNGAAPFNVYVITATASSGSYGTPDYVSRSTQATITDANPPP